MNAREYLQGASPKVSDEKFHPLDDEPGDDRRAFRVTLRLYSKRELEQIIRDCSTKKLEKQPDGSRTFAPTVDTEKLRARMAGCVTAWDGLTFGLLADLGNLATPNGDKASWATKPVECSTDNVVVAMETILGFEAWLMQKASALADLTAQAEVREKNASASTPAASTPS